MSELVENVARAVRPHLYAEGGNSEVVARAAIAAVAEWLDDALKDDDGRIYVPQFLRNKLEQPK